MMRLVKYLFAAAVLVLLVLPTALSLLTEWWWFRSQGYETVLWVRWWTKLGLGLGATLISFAILKLNVTLVRRRVPPQPALYDADRRGAVRAVLPTRAFRLAPWLILLGSLFLGAWMGGWGGRIFPAGDHWAEFQQFLQADPFGAADPQFGLDLGFYLFKLPFLKTLFHFLFGLLFLALLATLGLYALHFPLRAWGDLPTVPPGVWAHLSGLGATLFLVKAWGYWLNRFDLLLSQHGVVFGAGYTDLHARLPMLWILAGLAVLGALGLVGNLFVRRWWLLGGPVALLLLTSLLGGTIYPTLVQRLAVQPNESEREAPYLARNIAGTRQAFGLDRIQERLFDPQENLTPERLAANAPTIQNIRLWDELPLERTYGQLQEIRTYYQFNNVDVDRYQIDGRLTQVALAARELDFGSLEPKAQTWVNRHLVYTHGYGLCLAPVNTFTEDGFPVSFIKDIPPRWTSPSLRVDRPQIYFGEAFQPQDYVVVKIKASENTREFDYPQGQENVYTTYTGTAGVELSSFFRRLAFAVRFRHFKLLITRSLTPESRILLHRQIQECVQTLAPFLELDHDPYLVVAEGRLVWLLDAYTTARTYPYSEPFNGFRVSDRSPLLPVMRFRPPRNYMRNSVKITVDAYDGTVTFYLFDETDPVARTYRNIFPRLFQPRSALPAAIRAHVRYPQDLFYIQASLYCTYHMTDPRVFYNREDMWELATEKYGADLANPALEKSSEMIPYYLIMRLPGEDREEFLILVPFTPRSGEDQLAQGQTKNNMIAWLCARCDYDRFGDLVVFNFPKQRLIYGPMQIEARIDQDSEISKELTLWEQRGSRVIRGNLLVIPIDDSLLYVEPLYLSAETQPLPQLKRVIVAYGGEIAMRPTLDAALRAVFGQEEPPTGATEAVTVALDRMRQQLQTGLKHYEAYRQNFRQGQFAAGGAELDQFVEIVRQAAEPPEEEGDQVTR